MKYIFFSVFFLGWGLITLISVCLIVPLILLMETEWFDYPMELLNKC